MFSVISTLSAPLIVINAGLHYLTWPKEGLSREQITAAAKTHKIANGCFAAAIFIVGAAAAVVLAYKLQNPTPLIITAMGFRIVAMAAIALAVYVAGAVVNDLCERALRMSSAI